VKVWEVKFSRAGEFEKVARAFDLTGHSSGVYSFSFSADSSRMATVSKDGTWKVFDTAVEFTKGQDPTVIMNGSYSWDSNLPSNITISPDGKVVALNQDKSLAFYSVLSGDSAGSLTDVHSESVSQVIFSSGSDLVFTSGDRHVRVFHNVPGMRIQIQVQCTVMFWVFRFLPGKRIHIQLQCTGMSGPFIMCPVRVFIFGYSDSVQACSGFA